MDEVKSNSEEIEEELTEKIDNSEILPLEQPNVPTNENDEGKNENFENKEETESERTDNKSENIDQDDLNEKTNRSSRSSVVSNQQTSKSNSPFISRSVNFELKKKNQNYSKSKNNINSDFYLSSVNEMKHIGEQFKVGKINSQPKSPFEERFEKRYEKTLKKFTANSKNFDQNQILSSYRRTKDAKNLLDTQFTLVNELKYTDQQFKFGKLDPRAKSPFEERFQKKYIDRLKVLFTNSNRMSMELSYNELKNIHNTLCISKKVKN